MNANDYIKVLRDVPGCHYVAEQGRLLFATDELCEVLGNLLFPMNLKDLFFDEHERDHTLNEVRCHPECATSGSIYLSKKDGSAVYVRHQARMVRAADNSSGEIIIGSVSLLESDYSLREELAVYRKLLNRLKAGVHVLDRPRVGEEESRIAWMNEFEAKLLRVDTRRISSDFSDAVTEPLYASELAGGEESSKREVVKSVCAKFAGKKPATDMRPREFHERSPEGESKPIPVRIQDYFVASNPRDKTAGRPARIVTLVLPLALPTKLVQFLAEKGARAPVLEELGVRSFEKHQPDRGQPIQFRFLNKLFRRDNRPSDQEWQQLQLAKGMTVGPESDDDYTWDQLIESFRLSDSDLYPLSIADRFNADDHHVMENGKPLKGFEPHPRIQPDETGEQHSEVQFLKIPIVEKGLVVGLSGFYWPVEETDSIVSKLLHVLEKEREDVLDDLPRLFHVIRKNSEKKFVFVNKRHALEHDKAPSAFIGMTDIDVFEYDTALAKNYAKDDERVLDGKIVARYEPHRSSATAEVRQVLTIKSPIHGPNNNVNGIQCIYWYTHELDDLLRQTRIADGVAAPAGAPKAKAQIFVSYARKNRGFLVGSTSANPQLTGFQETLEVLQKVHGIRYWIDERRSEDVLDPEIKNMIETSHVFVLLLSPAFFVSDYIRNTELPLIRSRKSGDPSVRILPIIVQPVDYQGSKDEIVEWLRGIPAHNAGNGEWRHAVDTLVRDGKETAFWDSVSKRIRRLVENPTDE